MAASETSQLQGCCIHLLKSIWLKLARAESDFWLSVMWVWSANAQNAGPAALTRGPGGTCLLMAIAVAVRSLALATSPGPLLLCCLLLHGLLLRPRSLLLCRMLACLQTLCTLLELLGVHGEPCCFPGCGEGGLNLHCSLADGAAWRIKDEAVVDHLQQWLPGPWQALQQVWQQ